MDKLGPETGQANRHGGSFDSANDESAKKGSKNCTGATEDGGAAQEDRGQRVQEVTIPMAIMDEKERSISPAMTTMVSGMAMIAKKGMVDMKAK